MRPLMVGVSQIIFILSQIMKKFAVIPAVLVLLAAGTVSAQVYSYPSYGTSSVGCVALSSNLSYGSRGSEVTKLQQFLVSQNYPGGGSWMITGYFGNATVQAVRNFQQTVGLSTTGYVDAATRSAIQTRTCLPGQGLPSQGGLLAAPSNPTPIAFPSIPVTPTYPTPPYIPGANVPPYGAPTYPYAPHPYGGVSISSLSTQNAYIGSSVTIQGNGFDATGTNTVHIGPSTVVVAGTASSITFTVPSMGSGTYSVYVTNSRGTSNSLTLSVSQTQSVCNPAPWYQPWNWFGTQYQCGIYSNVALSSLSPNWSAIGVEIKVKGNGFSATNNTIYMGGSIVTNVGSTNNGTELSFTVPSQLSGPYGLQPVVPGHYPVRVVNATGAESNSLTLSITQQGSSLLSIASTNGPGTIQAGSLGTWTLVVNVPYGAYLTTTVNWGDSSSAETSAGQPGYLSGAQTLTFTHVYANPGTFTINFTVTSGLPGQGGNTTSATKTVTVISAPSGGSLNLNSLSPMQGSIGTTVTINGSGFTQSDNIVHFGIGGLRNTPSLNGTQISYVIPSYISACDLVQPGYFCGAPTQTVTPGVYPIYVQNGNGASNILYYTVQ